MILVVFFLNSYSILLTLFLGDDLKSVAGGGWMWPAQNQNDGLSLGETFVQQWNAIGCYMHIIVKKLYKAEWHIDFVER